MDETPNLSARDRLRRHQWLQATPAERVRAMARLQQATWEILRSSPAGYARFLRRNFKARAIPSPQGPETGRDVGDGK